MIGCLIIIFVFHSCGKGDIYLTEEQENDIASYMEQAELWSAIFNDKSLIPYGAFAPETIIPFSSVVSTDSSRMLTNQFIYDLGIANDRTMHDWIVNYGVLIQEIKADNVMAADETYFKNLTTKIVASIFNSEVTYPCIIEAHSVLQQHAYKKAVSYGSTTFSVNGPAFDLNSFMTLRGIDSGLYRMHRFIEARNKCQ
ncbi:MAG: hypothetical protein HKN68_23015 [Saprospiraceae bacterium]|nr:hypothetical protein [Saprospiraceae bacterium]